MPPQYNRIPEITQVPEDLSQFMEAVNTAIRALNEVMQELNTADSQFRGRDGYTPTFEADVDMGDLRLKNIARSKDGGDAVTRRELEEIGILGNAAGVVFSSPVTFASGASSAPSSGGGDELTTGEDVIDAVNAIVEGALPVTQAGESVSIQGYGQTGNTQGTLSMGRNGFGRAEFISVREGAILVSSSAQEALLYIIAQHLERIDNGLQNYWRSQRPRRRRHFALTSSDDLD